MLLLSILLVSFGSFTFCQANVVRDIDGNVYRTVRIGSKIWMAENLKTTRYSDGRSIEQLTDDVRWSTTSSPAWCWYSNDASYENPYGRLYNWYAISESNLCPNGWHIPSESEVDNNSEWSTLINRLGGASQAGGKLKESGYAHWLNPNVRATNATGFTGLPGGSRKKDGTFDGVRFEGLWWNTLERNAWGFSWSRCRILFYDSNRIDYFDGDKRMGLSVRCVKD